jgi:O-succinylbenzoic acid--CoA ligase
VVTTDGTAEPGAPGEIVIAGPTVCSGYLGEEAVALESLEQRWFFTGDIGFLDDEGYLYVLDRRDDLIVSGGENVYPAEVEHTLLGHPLVADAAVVGVPHENWGTRPVAAVVWRGNPATAAEALTAHCRQCLAPFKIPARFVLVDEIPRSASGKLVRRQLRESFAAPPG